MIVETELWGRLELYLWRMHPAINLVLALEFLCLLLIWLKLLFTPDGKLRKTLLWFFGIYGLTTGAAVFLYHPWYNSWLLPLCEVPHLIALLHLTIYMIREFGIGGRPH